MVDAELPRTLSEDGFLLSAGLDARGGLDKEIAGSLMDEAASNEPPSVDLVFAAELPGAAGRTRRLPPLLRRLLAFPAPPTGVGPARGNPGGTVQGVRGCTKANKSLSHQPAAVQQTEQATESS